MSNLKALNRLDTACIDLFDAIENGVKEGYLNPDGTPTKEGESND